MTESLFRKHLNLITKDSNAWLELLAEDCVIEFPYAYALGLPTRYEGKAAIRDYLSALAGDFDGFSFSKLMVHPHANPNELTAEFEGHIPAMGERGAYDQQYICFFRAEGEKISFYREYWNPGQMKVFAQ
jgi:ketosteroid isomerase-like protein